jgi:phage shock protein E
MASRHPTKGTAKAGYTRTAPTTASRRAAMPVGRRGGLTGRQWAVVASGVAIVLVAIIVGWSVASNRGGSTAAAGSSGSGSDGTVVQASGGQWTNITPAKLTSMLKTKDFTLLNVKTPYSGEIAGTDLYIPYTDLAARAAELPADKSAKVVVYCRSGHESAIAAQSLLDLGYTNIDNLDGGMIAWTANGGQLIQVAR